MLLGLKRSGPNPHTKTNHLKPVFRLKLRRLVPNPKIPVLFDKVRKKRSFFYPTGLKNTNWFEMI